MAFSEKYVKKLMGKNNIEHALKRLDRLTQEEARMASAQLLQITNAIDDRVAGVDERVAGVDDRVVGVDERVAGVADGVDRIERSWFPNRIYAGHAASSS
jgi:hypothetical protein